MTLAPAAGAAGSAPAEAPLARLPVAEAVLDAAIQARRAGTLPELLRQRPLVARWLLRRYLDVLWDAAADADLTGCAELTLAWLVAELRPDGRPALDGATEEAWLQLPGWRPFLAMGAHLGLLAVPDFPRRYRRRPDESAVDNLCGLWDVGPSTVYRLLERARLAMARTLLEPADAARRLSLRRYAAAQACGDGDAPAWHRRRADAAAQRHDAMSELWHRAQAHDADGANRVLAQHASVLAAQAETDAVLAQLTALPAGTRQRFDLCLAQAAVERTRSHADRELRAYEQARQVAQDSGDRLLLGTVYSALGKYHEPRDADRAFACYQDSADFLRDLDPGRGDEQTLSAFITTYVRLAWLYLQRNDPRSKTVLDRAEALRTQQPLPDPLLGLLEQVWGLYWRRSGDIDRSLEHRQRALNIFERIGDRRSTLAALLNIASDLVEKRDLPRAVLYAERVLSAARGGTADAEIVGSAHGTLGSIHGLMGDADRAIAQYETALAHVMAFNLRRLEMRTRFNLAEAHYTRFAKTRDPDDERRADAYVAEVLHAGPAASSAEIVESARKLKSSILEAGASQNPNRLIPAEEAAHYDEMQEVAAQRQVLALPAEPEKHAHAHLAIARSYAAIAAKEREAARALVEREGLHERFASEFAGLRQAFERELTREEQVAARWKDAAPELLDDARRAALAAQLLREGALTKRSYGELAAVAPATASKHLALLAERGLLVQQGKGPSTRYELPTSA